MGTRISVVVTGGAVIAALAGCSTGSGGNENLVAGKTMFVQKCGSCHVLKRAGTTGVSGPNLDEAFHQARKDGFGESTIRGMVHAQILNPNPTPQTDPKTNKPAASMPANLVKGDDAHAVAAYVARVAGQGGEDEGVLASVGAKREDASTEASNGVLDLPADESGLLAYDFNEATAAAGALTLRSPNPSSIDHNIAIEGNGVDEIGPVVKNGGVSEVQVDLQPGEYTYYCSVQGHREGGMVGKLTVE